MSVFRCPSILLVAGVVGVVGEDGEGAVDLLGEDDASQFVGQRDVAEGEDEAGAGAGGCGPTVGGADGEEEGLRAGVAQAAEVGGEFFAGELLAAAVEQDEDRGGACRLAIECGQQGGFGGVVLGLTGEVARGAGEIVGGEGGCGV